MDLNKLILPVLFLLTGMNIYGQDCKALVKIKTDIPSARIYINDDFTAQGSAELELKRGVYRIVITEEADRWDSQSFEDTLNLTNCSDTTFNFHFKTEVYLNTEPQDVYVYTDSTLIGHTPLFLSVNSGDIILKKPGFKERIINVNDLSDDKKIELDFTGEIKGENFFEKNVFKLLVGGIVALGSVSAYFKLKADDNFDQYQFSGNKYYLDQTHKYDLLSGLSFGAVQIGFAFLIYYFLSD